MGIFLLSKNKFKNFFKNLTMLSWSEKKHIFGLKRQFYLKNMQKSEKNLQIIAKISLRDQY